MKNHLLLLFMCVSCWMLADPSASATVAEQCSSALTKVMSCVGYSTGKDAAPSESCCSSTKAIRSDQPVCLCYLIQQTFKGTPQIKQLGVKTDRLLQLPADCKLTNTSVAECPKLLNLSPTAPEYAIFTNSSSSAKSNSTSTVTSSPDSSSGSVPSSGSISISVFLSLMGGRLLCMIFFKP